jgi:hypothetical protein
VPAAVTCVGCVDSRLSGFVALVARARGPIRSGRRCGGRGSDDGCNRAVIHGMKRVIVRAGVALLLTACGGSKEWHASLLRTGVPLPHLTFVSRRWRVLVLRHRTGEVEPCVRRASAACWWLLLWPRL